MFNYSILNGAGCTRRWNLKPIHQHLSVTGNFYQPPPNCAGKIWFVFMDLLLTSWYTSTGVRPWSINLKVIKLVIGIGSRAAHRWFPMFKTSWPHSTSMCIQNDAALSYHQQPWQIFFCSSTARQPRTQWVLYRNISSTTSKVDLNLWKMMYLTVS